MIYFTFYTNWMIRKNMKGATYGPFIFIRPASKDDRGMLEHEKTHVRQFYRNPLFGLWYWLSKKDRLRYEAEAYREQLRWYEDDRTEKFAELLMTRYGLNITKEEALQALKG
jgi:hypothetical protein